MMVTNQAHKSSRMHQSGKILVELLLVTPLLLFIPAAVMEYSRYMRLNQLAVTYSQDAANRVYRQCADFIESDPNTVSFTYHTGRTTTLTGQCVAGIWDDYRALIGAHLPPGSNLVLSVYRYGFTRQNGDTNLTQVAVVPPQTGPPPLASRTVFQVSGGALKRSGGQEVVLASASASRERLVVAEVTYVYTPSTWFLQGLMGGLRFGISTSDGAFRETTIL